MKKIKLFVKKKINYIRKEGDIIKTTKYPEYPEDEWKLKIIDEKEDMYEIDVIKAGHYDLPVVIDPINIEYFDNIYQEGKVTIYLSKFENGLFEGIIRRTRMVVRPMLKIILDDDYIDYDLYCIKNKICMDEAFSILKYIITKVIYEIEHISEDGEIHIKENEIEHGDPYEPSYHTNIKLNVEELLNVAKNVLDNIIKEKKYKQFYNISDMVEYAANKIYPMFSDEE